MSIEWNLYFMMTGEKTSKEKSYEHVGKKICILSAAECLCRQKDGAFEITLELHRGPENIQTSSECSLETQIQTHNQHSLSN